METNMFKPSTVGAIRVAAQTVGEETGMRARQVADAVFDGAPLRNLGYDSADVEIEQLIGTHGVNKVRAAVVEIVKAI